MKTMDAMISKTVKLSGYKIKNAMWVDIEWNEGVCSARLRVDLEADAGDTQDALDDRVELVKAETAQKISEIATILDKSREMAKMGKPHEITSDLSRANDPTVIYHPDKIVVSAAKSLARAGRDRPFSVTINDSVTTDLQPPVNGKTWVVDTTKDIVEEVEVATLSKPHEGHVVYMRKVGGKRKLYCVSYEMEQYGRLYEAMSPSEDPRFRVVLRRVVGLVSGSGGNAKYALVSLNPVGE